MTLPRDSTADRQRWQMLQSMDSGVQIVTIEIMVLDTIADDSGAILAKDSADNLYVDTQPVLYQGQPVPQAFFGHTVVGVRVQLVAWIQVIQRMPCCYSL